MFKIRQIEQKEIPQLKKFPPKDWNLDIPKLFSFHYGYPYFYPAVAEVDKKIVGCGIANVNGTIGWLGTIIVLSEYRGQGIGTGITSNLIQNCKDKGCTTIMLTASEMGEPIYNKLGFRRCAEYLFFKRSTAIPVQNISNVRQVRQSDLTSIKHLDRELVGETRFSFLKRFISTGWVYNSESSEKIGGLYLPDHGTGLILAKNPEAGLALMRMRLNNGKTNAIIPSVNIIAKEFLEAEKFHVYRTTPRMILGKDVNWQPAMMYNRATGYCG
jgi:GNAT superfamily N-acetyltransferase